jgi:hypothetical protein
VSFYVSLGLFLGLTLFLACLLAGVFDDDRMDL